MSTAQSPRSMENFLESVFLLVFKEKITFFTWRIFHMTKPRSRSRHGTTVTNGRKREKVKRAKSYPWRTRSEDKMVAIPWEDYTSGCYVIGIKI